MPQRHFTKVAEFTDRYGVVQTIRKKSVNTSAMKLQRTSDTPSLRLNKVVARLIAEKIRAAREAAGMTMERLGAKAGLTGNAKNRIWNIENSMDTGLRIGTLYALAHALSVDPRALMPTAEEAFELAGVASETVERLAVKGA